MPEQATYKVTYNNKDWTADISSSLISIDYTDNTQGESDELSITLEDREGLWKNEWQPEFGATLEAFIYSEGKQLNCGIFIIDEMEGAGSKQAGDVVIIKALSAGIKDEMRTIKSLAHANKTLKEIATTIANKYAFKIVGTVPNILLGYEVQHRETDLHYLSRISAEYGVIFSIRGKQMTFTDMFALEGGASIFSFKKSDLINYRIKDKTADTFLRATSTFFSPTKKQVVSQTINAEETTKGDKNFRNDYLEIKIPTENEQQAARKAKAGLYAKNIIQQEGSIDIQGNVAIVAGINIELTELGNMSGIFHVEKSSHKVNRQGGYLTDAELKKVNTVDAIKKKQPDK